MPDEPTCAICQRPFTSSFGPVVALKRPDSLAGQNAHRSCGVALVGFLDGKGTMAQVRSFIDDNPGLVGHQAGAELADAAQQALISQLSPAELEAREERLRVKEEQRRASEMARERRKGAASVQVTTADFHRPYEVIAPVYIQVNNKGLFANYFNTLVARYSVELSKLKSDGQIYAEADGSGGAASLIGEGAVQQGNFEIAFFVAMFELQARAAMLRADAIVGLRQDIDVDAEGRITNFYLQMYGTAIKFLD
jgi:hypothetical protein